MSDSDSLETLPVPKTVKYSSEEIDVHNRFIEDDKKEVLTEEEVVSDKWYSPFMSLKIIAVIILLAFAISSNAFYNFLDTIKYLNEQPMKIRVTQLTTFVILSYLTQYL